MRRFSYLLLAACLCLPMVGCGGDAAPPKTDPPAADEGDAGSGGGEEADAGEGEAAAE